MNNTFSSSYTHKRGEQPDSDHSDEDDDNQFPGYKIRKEAFNILVENHKNKVFQHNEEKEAKKLKKLIKRNELKDKEAQEDTNEHPNEKQ
eukprot:16365961-Heterocapsa_arctica.AAC.1